jgi:hypothetical protein
MSDPWFLFHSHDPALPWKHLIPLGYAPGGYMVACIDCQKTFCDLDKRAWRCYTCAIEKYAKTIEGAL